MIKDFNDCRVDFYFYNDKVDHTSKMYDDALRTINEAAQMVWDAEPHLEDWTDKLGINYCGSLIEIIEAHTFVYLCNRIARKRCYGFILDHDHPMCVVEGGDDAQDHWMINLIH